MIEKNYEKGGAFVSEISWAILHRHVREGASQMDQLSETTLEWIQWVDSTSLQHPARSESFWWLFGAGLRIGQGGNC